MKSKEQPVESKSKEQPAATNKEHLARNRGMEKDVITNAIKWPETKLRTWACNSTSATSTVEAPGFQPGENSEQDRWL